MKNLRTRTAVAAAAVLNTIPAMAAPGELFPSYPLQTTWSFSRKLTADIAGSAFMGVDGRFHWITSVANYGATDDGGSYTRTFTADDFGALTHNYPAVENVTYDSYWNKPGTFCYQLDKRANNPMPSLYQDDHCDVIGIWTDPATKTWYGVVNDEYQFNPWVAEQSQNDRIKTGRHNNRVMLASSADEGKTWELVDQICTDEFQPQQTITAELFPNQTYSWGLSGTRFFPDYITGYAYVLYNHQFRNKVGDATLAQYFTLARAPLSGGLAPNTWRKYANGKWDQPGIGGHDGYVGEPLGLNVKYDPKTDLLSYTGKGADGSTVDFRSTPFTKNGSFSFSDPSGAKYVATMSNNTIVHQDNGESVGEVSYHDPALDRTITVGLTLGKLTVNSTDNYGATTTFNPGKAWTVFKDPATQRLYVQPSTILESAFQYNVQSGKYRAVGYDHYVYENADLGSPNDWIPVGKQPDIVLTHAAYKSTLDTGSLTNQNIGARTFSAITDLYGATDVMTAIPPTDGQTSYSHDAVLKDSCGAPIAASTLYHISIGSAPLELGNNGAGNTSDTWTLEALMDTYEKSSTSGLYRLKSSNGQYLQVSGDTPAAKRAWGAAATLCGALPDYDPSGNGGNGSPGGSDQWYFIPIGGNTPKALDAGSSQGDVEAAQKTSLNNACGYKLANRNSGLVLAFVDGKWATVANDFSKNDDHKVTIKL